jgi:hypothetical protein
MAWGAGYSAKQNATKIIPGFGMIYQPANRRNLRLIAKNS